MAIELFYDEKTISVSDTKEITLTSHRFQQYIKHGGKTIYTTIMLEDIVSIQMIHKKNYWFILLAIMAAIGGGIAIGSEEGGAAIICFVLAAIFILLFSITAKGIVSVNSAKGSIDFNTKGMEDEKIISFLQLLEKTKKERVEFLNK